MKNSNRELYLAPTGRVSHACGKHRAGSWQNNVKNAADVGPYSSESWHVTDDLPQLLVRVTDDQCLLSSVGDCLVSETRCLLLVVRSVGVLRSDLSCLVNDTGLSSVCH